jgi:hypothetical protein
MDSTPSNNDSIIHYNTTPVNLGITGHIEQQHNTNGSASPSFPTIIKLIEGSLLDPVVNDPQSIITTGFQNFMPNSQSIAHSLLRIQKDWGVTLDKKQVMAYDIICCTFLIDILREYSGNNLLRSIADVINHTNNISDERRIHEKLKARGGEDSLRMFLTGPAGAGKTTAIKAAQRYCHEFCQTSGLYSSVIYFFVYGLHWISSIYVWWKNHS